MIICPNCQQAYSKFLGEVKSVYDGGSLIVTDFPHSRCACDTTISLSDGIRVELYRNRLNEHETRGDISISLNLLSKIYKAGEIIDQIKIQHEEIKKINWMKDKLAIASNKELISKALELLFKRLELEEKGYTLHALKETKLPEGIDHIIFQ